MQLELELASVAKPRAKFLPVVPKVRAEAGSGVAKSIRGMFSAPNVKTFTELTQRWLAFYSHHAPIILNNVNPKALPSNLLLVWMLNNGHELPPRSAVCMELSSWHAVMICSLAPVSSPRHSENPEGFSTLSTVCRTPAAQGQSALGSG